MSATFNPLPEVPAEIGRNRQKLAEIAAEIENC